MRPNERRNRTVRGRPRALVTRATVARLTRLFLAKKYTPPKRKISSHVGTRLITSYVVWICVCPADFSRGSMVQVSGVLSAHYRRVIRPRRAVSAAFFWPCRRREFLIVFFSLRCHPLVNRKDGSRLLRFFPRAYGPGRTFFPGHRDGPGRVSRRNYRRNRPPSAFPRTGFVTPAVFLNETSRSPRRTGYPPHSPTRCRRVPRETRRSRGRFARRTSRRFCFRLTYARGSGRSRRK